MLSCCSMSVPLLTCSFQSVTQCGWYARIECNGTHDKLHVVLRSKTRNVFVALSFESLLQNMRYNDLGIPKTSLQATFSLHCTQCAITHDGNGTFLNHRECVEFFVTMATRIKKSRTFAGTGSRGEDTNGSDDGVGASMIRDRTARYHLVANRLRRESHPAFQQAPQKIR